MTDLYQGAYNGKRVFLTGHTGFKGSWLLLLLRQLGATVKGYSLAPDQEQNLFDLIRWVFRCANPSLPTSGDRDRLHAEMTAFHPDVVFHLAAQAIVLESYRNPVDTYSTNVMGTVHVLDAFRQLDHPSHAVVITTDKVYENLEHGIPYKEDDRLGGFDPYSNSKACTELAASSYRNSLFPPNDLEQHGKAMATARSGNVNRRRRLVGAPNYS